MSRIVRGALLQASWSGDQEVNDPEARRVRQAGG